MVAQTAVAARKTPSVGRGPCAGSSRCGRQEHHR